MPRQSAGPGRRAPRDRALLADFGGDHIPLAERLVLENSSPTPNLRPANGALLGAGRTGLVAGAARAESGEAAGCRPDRRHPCGLTSWADRRRRAPTSPRQSATRPETTCRSTGDHSSDLPRGTARVVHARGVGGVLAETDAGIAAGVLDTSCRVASSNRLAARLRHARRHPAAGPSALHSISMRAAPPPDRRLPFGMARW